MILNRNDLSHLDRATPAEEAQFWTAFEAELARDDGEAAREHLATGHPIFVSEPDYPGRVIRRNPDGSRDLMVFDEANGVLRKDRRL
ncbi:conserved hypothetical protein [Paraburkholderia tropica]|uniref:hypothetical protein n=1 Tax=Paraburkholderia tropica TaxID=92647 RepID=UPI001CAC5674|nr:hypothetical protein [Paraburkholderia tropica]CAG9229977.1 conserved hypothetical protein [Paraburkholderia tropica]